MTSMSTGNVHSGTIKLVVTVTILADEHTLMVRYKDMPDRQSGWFVPNDLLVYHRHPDESAQELVSDQLGLELKPRLHHIDSFVGNDSSWHLSIHYKAHAQKKEDPRAADRIREWRWFALDHLPPVSDVAHHGWSLQIIDSIISA